MDGHCWRCALWRVRTFLEGTGFLCKQCTEHYAEKRCNFRLTPAGMLDYADQNGKQVY